MKTIKKITFVFTALFLFCSAITNAQNSDAFITVWQTSNTSIMYPGIGTGYTIVVRDLNTGNVLKTITNATSVQNSPFAVSGLAPATPYSFEVEPGTVNFTGFRVVATAERLNLLEIKQWGKINWRADMAYAFDGCENVDLTATDQPNFASVTVLAGMFRGCLNLVGNNSISSWPTGNVRNMGLLFAGAPLFNQPLNWDVSRVTSMASMFLNATSFNQSLGNWDLSARPNMSGFFNGSGMDCKRYDSTLIGWANNPKTPAGVSMGASGLFYSSPAAVTARQTLVSKTWSITGDVFDSECHTRIPFGVDFTNFGARLRGSIATLKATSSSISPIDSVQEFGFVVGNKRRPTIGDTKLTVTPIAYGEISSVMTNLALGSVYFARAYATSKGGKTVYSLGEVTFSFVPPTSVPPGFPPVITFDSSNLVVSVPIVFSVFGDEKKIFENATWQVDNNPLQSSTWTPSTQGIHIIQVTSSDKKSSIKRRIIIK